ncbi:MAG: Nuclear control of ATPase protein 2 [Cirrosporium novae-zelandiae]|nr:MAG: Nuclear control of ATPase protein 2 [Cirrosporium novae-zelandiae]
MSFVSDIVRRIDNQLEGLHRSSVHATTENISLASQTDGQTTQPQSKEINRINQLQKVAKALSTTASPVSPLLYSRKIQQLLAEARLPESSEALPQDTSNAALDVQTSLEWLIVGKATIQTHGLILNTLLDQTIPISNDIWYWDDILGSYAYTCLYSLQTSPLRLWGWSRSIYQEARQRWEREGLSTLANDQRQNISNRWMNFYGLVRQTIQERSIVDIQSRLMLSPFAASRMEARRNQKGLRRLRELSASGLGVILDEGLSFDLPNDAGEWITSTDSDSSASSEWVGVVAKSISLMEAVLSSVTTLEIGVTDFEESVFLTVENDSEVTPQISADTDQLPIPGVLAKRLQQILAVHLPKHLNESRSLTTQYGRPSRIVRYWPAATALLLSGSTILRIIVQRKADIIQWIRDLGTTTVDFWVNWVIEPVKKLIGTIRHDEGSEIAIMSKSSLEGDRESLERMVVDFAIDHPYDGQPLNETQIIEVRSKVKEGDLTPVLKAYERDLRKPLMGTVRGDLIRAMLIQIQKTKVDVEVAIGGIDALLKDQELVFGFVGLTPGIIVSLTVFRWLMDTFGNRRGLRTGQQRGQMIRILRNIHRILTSATNSNNGILSYKERGLLLCEIHLFRERARMLLPSDVNREIKEEINDLVNHRVGIEKQLKVVDRILWAYRKWLR